MRCDACGSEHLRVEVIFPPVSSLDLKHVEGHLFRHVRTGRLYRIWKLCDACRHAIKVRSRIFALPFAVKKGKRSVFEIRPDSVAKAKA